jgi:hypothetical protein
MTTHKKYLAIGSLMVFAAMTRLVPHPFNFTAIGALALFSGSVIPNRKLAFCMPLVVMLLTDALLGFHQSMIPVYLCFAITVFLGMYMVEKINVLSVTAASVLSSILFFAITNLPFWYADISLYPLTWQGTVESYTAALPFFGNQLAGDLFYNATLFGVFVLVSNKSVESVKQEA